jgi:uncharacterized membrane protein YozB (DUF420 family)
MLPQKSKSVLGINLKTLYDLATLLAIPTTILTVIPLLKEVFPKENFPITNKMNLIISGITFFLLLIWYKVEKNRK